MQRETKSVAWVIKACAFSIFAFLYYCVFMLGLYLVSLAALQKDIILNVWPLIEFQRREYFGEFPIVGTRNVWQRFRDCVETDSYVVYRPKTGTCRFVNHEFDTLMSFDKSGRISEGSSDLLANGQSGIAVLGDSFAMGWGVQDNETFASVLQHQLKRRVFNLGVSSYGTRRELRRLIQTGVVDQVDTIVIQYCENDIGENRKSLTDADYAQLAKDYPLNISFEEAKKTLPKSFGVKDNAQLLGKRLYFAAIEPFSRIDSVFSEMDFRPHYEALIAVLSEYKSQLSGKQIIVFYVNGGNQSFSNFPVGPDLNLPNVVFYQPPLSDRDFFPLDKHLNADGHRHIANAIASVLTR
jgi:hypothetical protein